MAGNPERAALQPKRPQLLGRAEREKVATQLWKTSVRDWMQVHDVNSAPADWELPKADERVLLEWFDAIDIDRSGDVDASEIRALLASNRIGCSPARLEHLFSKIGKNVDQGLTLHDFVKLMHSGGGAALFLKSFVPPKRHEADGPEARRAGSLSSSATKGKDHHHHREYPYRRDHSHRRDSTESYGSYGESSVVSGTSRSDGRGGAYGEVPEYAEAEAGAHGMTLAECRSDGDLAVLTYRRQRVLRDLQSGAPSKRSHFQTRDAFLKKYSPGALPTYKEALRGANGKEAAGSDPYPELTDVEQRLAADGNFFKQQLEAAKQQEAEEAKRIAAVEREEEERVKAERAKERTAELTKLPKMSEPSAKADAAGNQSAHLPPSPSTQRGGGPGSSRPSPSKKSLVGSSRKRHAASTSSLSHVHSAKAPVRHYDSWRQSAFATGGEGSPRGMPRTVSLPALPHSKAPPASIKGMPVAT